MNIYIKIEVLSREIDSRLLLGLVAAERGHRVLVGDFRRLLSHRLWLPPGIYHEKSMTPSASKIALYEELTAAGFAVTSQDEEHGLLETDYERHATARFSDRTLRAAALALMWGPHDTRSLQAIFPDFSACIVDTGSPRTDFWRREAAAYSLAEELPGLESQRPIILFAMHGWGSLSRNRFWDEIANTRPTYLSGGDGDRDIDAIVGMSADPLEVALAMRGVRAIAREHPQALIVVRPHPGSADGAWEALIGEIPNVVVRRDGSPGAWIHRAAVVVHHCSTMGLEAAMSGVPLVSLASPGFGLDLITSRLGMRASDADALSAAVRVALDASHCVTPTSRESRELRALLEDRVGPFDGPLASDRVVDRWEALTKTADLTAPLHPFRSRIMAEAHAEVGAMRVRLRPQPINSSFLTDHKFPRMQRSDIARRIRLMRSTFGRFEGVGFRMLGPRLIELVPGRRG